MLAVSRPFIVGTYISHYLYWTCFLFVWWKLTLEKSEVIATYNKDAKLTVEGHIYYKREDITT